MRVYFEKEELEVIRACLTSCKNDSIMGIKGKVGHMVIARVEKRVEEMLEAKEEKTNG